MRRPPTVWRKMTTQAIGWKPSKNPCPAFITGSYQCSSGSTIPLKSRERPLRPWKWTSFAWKRTTQRPMMDEKNDSWMLRTQSDAGLMVGGATSMTSSVWGTTGAFLMTSSKYVAAIALEKHETRTAVTPVR
jgi:hypothetical protein